ncbi:MAG TPA: FAD-binding protein, partial [Brachybacterium massiliense]|nr:FAD-binding protein [Brachybacterium massiliense]
MSQPIQALNILGGVAPTAQTAPAAQPETVQDDTIHEVVIVGSGPAGYTAAIYTARAEMKPIVIAGALDAGGALMTTTDVENFP